MIEDVRSSKRNLKGIQKAAPEKEGAAFWLFISINKTKKVNGIVLMK